MPAKNESVFHKLNKERAKWGTCTAAGILLVILSVVLLKGDAFVFWTWWLLALLFGAVFMPVTGRLFSTFEDRGWFFSKILGIAVCGYTEWLLTSVNVTVFSTASCVLVCAFYAGIMLILAHRQSKKGMDSLPWGHFRLIIAGELIFAAVFLLWTYLAGMNPNAYGTEKFMDYGFMEAMMRSRTLPAVDMWYSEGTINYYYGGQYFAVFLTKLSGSRVEVTYNLMRTFVAGFAFILPCSLVFQMLRDEGAKKHKKISGTAAKAAGAAAGAAVCFAGNMHYVVYRWIIPLITRLRGGEIPERYWFPDATRYIGFDPDVPDKTIHEFPCYSFVLGDLHAHVVNIIFVLLLIGILYAYTASMRDKSPDLTGGSRGILKELFIPHILAAGFLLALYQMNNFWDYVIYFVVAGGTILFTNLVRQKKLSTAVLVTAGQAAVFAGMSVLLILPFTLKFQTMVSGVALCRYHSLPHQLLILWGLPVFTSVILIIAVILDRRRDMPERGIRGFLGSMTYSDMFAGILALCAAGLVLIPEIVYVRDIYEEGNARANTMFKLTYQAFIMFGIVIGYACFRLLFMTGSRILRACAVLSLICLTSTVGYAGNATKSWFANSISEIKYAGLYALGHLETSFPEDAGAIGWLKENVQGSPVVLEANGDSYTGYCRVSASTGLPTPLGWYVHEWLWRSDTESINRISSDVKEIFTSRDPAVVKDLLINYNVSYIFVGEMEKEKFGGDMDTEFLRSLGKVVYEDSESGTMIIQVQGTTKGAQVI